VGSVQERRIGSGSRFVGLLVTRLHVDLLRVNSALCS
jgi:hypothetical protein